MRSELSSVIRSGNVRGSKRIPGGLQQLISVVDVDMSPDLTNARVKVSIIGDRKDKISAVRWLQSSARAIRYELAQRLRHMKRVPQLSFTHVDIGAATELSVKLAELTDSPSSATVDAGGTRAMASSSFDDALAAAAFEEGWIEEDS
jgi:ribosome-binding factor A